MKTTSYTTALLLLATVTVMGCTEPPQNEGNVDTPSALTRVEFPPGVDGSSYMLEAEPSDACSVIAARQSVEDGEELVVVGRIGGSQNPWVEGRAAFSIVDETLNACSDIPGDTCEMPWDYCCETHNLPSSTAMVKIVDDKGDMIKADARDLLGVAELSTVVVQGKAVRDDAGNLTILATAVFIRS
jgi:hypothetical protein